MKLSDAQAGDVQQLQAKLQSLNQLEDQSVGFGFVYYYINTSANSEK